jgi:hypothetical protein
VNPGARPPSSAKTNKVASLSLYTSARVPETILPLVSVNEDGFHQLDAGGLTDGEADGDMEGLADGDLDGLAEGEALGEIEADGD